MSGIDRSGRTALVTGEASWEAAVAFPGISGHSATPLGRLGEVSDMADAVVFLASDQSRFITGAGLPVDGGMGM